MRGNNNRNCNDRNIRTVRYVFVKIIDLEEQIMDFINNKNKTCSFINNDNFTSNENNETEIKYKIRRKNCLFITGFIIYIFILSTVYNLETYIHIKISRFILAYSNILYFVSFTSLHSQVELLIGFENGILPIDKYLKDVKKKLKQIHFFIVHKLVYWVYRFWKCIIYKRIHLKAVCKIGVCFSIINFIIQKRIHNDVVRICMSSFMFACLFFLLLSFKIVMRDFMIFQCDLLMNEFGFILIFLNITNSYYLKYANTLVICILRLVAFKILFSSGIQKYVNNRKVWLELNAFQNLFFCHPIPSILSYIGNYQFPKRVFCFLIIISEFFLSWLIFCSSRLRLFVFFFFIGVHFTCFVLCNYFLFAYICLFLFISLLDDSMFTNLSNSKDNIPIFQAAHFFYNWSISLLIYLCTLINFFFYLFMFIMNLVPIFEQWKVLHFNQFYYFYYVYYQFIPINICNSYGKFIKGLEQRRDIVIEELHDTNGTQQWQELNFINKPTCVNELGGILWTGHVPRLEWKLFFFSDQTNSNDTSNLYILYTNAERMYPIYMCSFLKKICEREQLILSVVQYNKNKEWRKKPVAIRLSLYDYRMVYQGTYAIRKGINRNIKYTGQHVDIGKYWIRTKIKTIETLKYKNA